MKNFRMTSYLLLFLCAMSLSFAAYAVDCTVDFDMDGDGHNSLDCGGDDCDDYDVKRYPGNVELCDAVDRDEDCDYTTFGERDADGDGFWDDRCQNVYPDGQTSSIGEDCDDSKRSIHPIATEACNGIDDNCDGGIDWEAQVFQYGDYDLDGYGDPGDAPMKVCPGTAGFSVLSNDCDDGNPAIGPGDQVCIEGAPEALLVCGSDGQWLPSTCPVDQQCAMQNNGTGLCVGVDSKSAGKNK